MARLYTPFNGPGGEDILTDRERLTANQGEGDAARAAAAEALRQQLALQAQMHQSDLADRQSGRAQQGAQFERGLQFEGDQAKAGRDFQGGMFDKTAGLQTNLARMGNEIPAARLAMDQQAYKDAQQERMNDPNYVMQRMIAQQLAGGNPSDGEMLTGALGGAPRPAAPQGQYDGTANPFGTSGGTPTRTPSAGGGNSNLVNRWMNRQFGEDPNEAFNRSAKQHMIQTAMDTLATSKDPKQVAKLSAFLKAQGMDGMDAFYSAPTGADARMRADAATSTYISSPIIQQRVRALVPSLVEASKQDPGGVAFAVSRAAQQFANEAAGEGGDAATLTPQITKMLSEALAPELEKLRPGLGSRLLQSLGSYVALGGSYPNTPVAADVLKQANY